MILENPRFDPRGESDLVPFGPGAESSPRGRTMNMDIAGMDMERPRFAFPMMQGRDMGLGGDFGGRLGLTIQAILARRAAADQFGRGPAPQGQFGPGMRGEPGGFTPPLGQRFVAQGFRTER